MTPTLAGRWQTRIVLFGTVGLGVCLLYGRLLGDRVTPIAMLDYALAFGLAWDVVYQWLLRRRWDHDWPTAFQIGAGVWEGAWVWAFTHAEWLWSPIDRTTAPGISPYMRLDRFVVLYFGMWLAIFLCTQGPLRVLMPRWRFQGGRVV